MSDRNFDRGLGLPLYAYDLSTESLLPEGQVLVNQIRAELPPHAFDGLSQPQLTPPQFNALVDEMSGYRNGQPAALKELRQVEPSEIDPGEISDIPSGYVYYGQFIVHDITFEPVAGFEAGCRPTRSFALDLDSLYGAGPTADPHIYDRDAPYELALVRSSTGPGRGQFDMPRNDQQIACAADPRNDEHVIISQIHVALARAHNALARAEVERGERNPRLIFERARRVLTALYQWTVVQDWLPKLLHPEVAAELEGAQIRYEPKMFRNGTAPHLTREFSFAGCRFGHAMVRPRYRINGLIPPLAIMPWQGQPAHAHLCLFRRLPPDWFVDWRLFFALSPDQRQRALTMRGGLLRPASQVGAPEYQCARLIKPRVTRRLGLLPQMPNLPVQAQPSRRLAERTLTAGRDLELPSGSALATALGIPFSGVPDMPLWFSILEDSWNDRQGKQLGHLGSRIVADTVVGALQLDADSVLRQPDFQPTVVSGGAKFDIAELLSLADIPQDDVNEWAGRWLATSL